MRYDYKKLYTKNREFLEKHGKLKQAVLLVNAYLPYLFAFAYALIGFYALFLDKLSVTEISKLVYLPLGMLLCVSTLQLAIARPRPYQETGANIQPLEKKKSTDNSMPSRHLASGAVIAVCVLPHLPLVGAFLLGCCLTLGYCRFAVGWHYPSDLATGFALGAIVGALTFVL